MQIATLIEPIAGRGFRASTRNPIEISVEAESREAAIRQLQDSVRERLADGAEIINVEAGMNSNPWIEFAGDLADHPLLEDWKRAMQEYRDQVDREWEAREGQAP
jgi:hypothetical protein